MSQIKLQKPNDFHRFKKVGLQSTWSKTNSQKTNRNSSKSKGWKHKIKNEEKGQIKSLAKASNEDEEKATRKFVSLFTQRGLYKKHKRKVVPRFSFTQQSGKDQKPETPGV